MPYRFLVLTALLAATALGGCDSLNRALGLDKVVPDEFAVVSRAPLAVPPDFSLRPPRIGAQRPQELPIVDQARQTVFRAGEDAKSNLPPAAEQRSPGEDVLLRDAGAAAAPSNIRQLVNTDTSSTSDLSDSFVDKLAFWRPKEQKLGATDNVIDPAQEAERLKDRKDQSGKGAAPLAGAPVIEKTKAAGSSSGWFGWLF